MFQVRAASREPLFPSPTKASRQLGICREGTVFFPRVQEEAGSRLMPPPPPLVAPHWWPFPLPPRWWPLSLPHCSLAVPSLVAYGRFPDAHSQVYTLTLDLTPEAGLRPRAPKLLIPGAGDSWGDNSTAPQPCQEASHLKTRCPLHRIPCSCRAWIRAWELMDFLAGHLTDSYCWN